MKLPAWIIPNALMGALLVLWIFSGHRWAGNIVTFGVWVLFVLTVLSSLTTEGRAKMMQRKLPVPHAVDAAYDVTFMLALVGAGHFLLGSLYVTHAILHHGALLAGAQERAA